MAKQFQNNMKLGIFVVAGLAFLIFLLFMIGRNKNLFGSTFILKTRFENVQGLRTGSNVRYSGIQVGTVRRVEILCDTLLEVTMVIDNKFKSFIHKNAVTSIGTDGLMGNKLINISAGTEEAAVVEEGNILPSRKAVDTDEMLRTLYSTNNNIKLITDDLKLSLERINSSTAVWSLLNDERLPRNISAAALNIRLATAEANQVVTDIHQLVNDVNSGRGSLGIILNDTSLAIDLASALKNIRAVGENADSLARQLNAAAGKIDRGITEGKGPVNALLYDSLMVMKLQLTLDNIQQGTDAFNENMYAMRNHFLFRGYFKKQEKEEQRNKKTPVE